MIMLGIAKAVVYLLDRSALSNKLKSFDQKTVNQKDGTSRVGANEG